MSFHVVERVVDKPWTVDDVPRTAVDIVAQVYLLLSLVPVQNDLRHKRNI